MLLSWYPDGLLAGWLGSDSPEGQDIVMCIPIARQRLGKHIPAQAYVHDSRPSIVRQWRSKHALLTIQTVFSVGSVLKVIIGHSQKKRQSRER
jgi:hypothetical protein